MAATRFAYVKTYELPDPILPNTYFIVRIDGQSFHRFSDVHAFVKPNDLRALQLMDNAAEDVLRALPDAVLAFGESDEFSFLFRRSATLFNRRESTVVSHFTSSYVFNWSRYFPDKALQYPPTFDARLVVYPGEKEVKDYFAWRQADTHINNLYNTVFWALVQHGGMSTSEAHQKLKGTVSADKNEILHSQFGINYNSVDARFRKGSVVVKVLKPVEESQEASRSSGHSDTGASGSFDQGGSETEVGENDITAQKIQQRREKKEAKKAEKAAMKKREWILSVMHCDVIGDEFWRSHPDVLQ
ncbi:tRNA-His guanylyltransferase [Tulasnella sp. UAMH 9824]|nr:tRNA-His guanylyltransferase [Tulasnella sp. UAMH 9824]